MAAFDYKAMEHGWANHAAMAWEVDEWIKDDIEALFVQEEGETPRLTSVRVVATHVNASGHLLIIYERQYG